MAALERVTGAPVVCEFVDCYNDPQYQRLRVEEKTGLLARVTAAANAGIGYVARGSPAKDSLIGYLTCSGRACAMFAAAVRRIVVDATTPAKALAAADNGLRFSLTEDGTLTCQYKLQALTGNATFDAWGPKASGLSCCVSLSSCC